MLKIPTLRQTYKFIYLYPSSCSNYLWMSVKCQTQAMVCTSVRQGMARDECKGNQYGKNVRAFPALTQVDCAL